MALSPISPIWKNSMRQSCTVYRYQGAEMDGQPIYGTGTEYPCRIALKTERTVTDEGDYITNSTVVITLPGDAEVQAYDRIDLPTGYQQGAVIREVLTLTDAQGRISHRTVRIA